MADLAQLLNTFIIKHGIGATIATLADLAYHRAGQCEQSALRWDTQGEKLLADTDYQSMMGWDRVCEQLHVISDSVDSTLVA